MIVLKLSASRALHSGNFGSGAVMQLLLSLLRRIENRKIIHSVFRRRTEHLWGTKHVNLNQIFLDIDLARNSFFYANRFLVSTSTIVVCSFLPLPDNNFYSFRFITQFPPTPPPLPSPPHHTRCCPHHHFAQKTAQYLGFPPLYHKTASPHIQMFSNSGCCTNNRNRWNLTKKSRYQPWSNLLVRIWWRSGKKHLFRPKVSEILRGRWRPCMMRQKSVNGLEKIIQKKRTVIWLL